MEILLVPFSLPVCQWLSKAGSGNNLMGLPLLFPLIAFSIEAASTDVCHHTPLLVRADYKRRLSSELAVLAETPQPCQLREQQLTRNQCDILCLWRRKG